MIKVLHIITGLDDGGAEGVLSRLCLNDHKLKHIVISMMDTGKYGPILRAAHIEVHTLGMPRGKLTLKAILNLASLLREIKPDVVQTWMYHADLIGGVIAKFVGCKAIFWNIRHADLSSSNNTKSTILIAKICAIFSRWIPNKIIVCAVKAAEIHADVGYSYSKMSVISNGYDLSLFKSDFDSRTRLRNELGIAEDQLVIGFVARYDPLKDHTNLLTALSHLKADTSAPVCLLVGTGMDKDNAPLMAEIERLGVSETVRLLGRRSDVPAIMNALDLHVMSSRSEAFPNVLAEAMACGTPCVSTDVGDAAAIVGESGIIVPPRDPDALAQAIHAMLALKETEHWAERKLQAQKHIQDSFSLETMINKYYDAWTKA